MKVDWLAACIALGDVGTVLIVFLNIAQSSSQWEAWADTKNKRSKHCQPIRRKETLTKYTPLTVLNQRKLALTARNKLVALLNHLIT
jgi:hypothetical protein